MKHRSPEKQTGLPAVEMLLKCHEIAREGGRNYSSHAFEELVNYMGKRLGINPNPLRLQQQTVERLDKELDMNTFTATLGDHLGEVFSKLELGNKALGQCLTPMTIADMMVMMNDCGNMKSGERILDPCTGTGVFLISALKVIPTKVELYGIELDSVLYRATLVQLTAFTQAQARDNPFFLLNADALMDKLDWSLANRWGKLPVAPTPVIPVTRGA